ncbi:hypothetical protein [Herpetosiphon geysericola]|uniref:Uncharacterized protein n=1 Tax=Herpetosiphon geysericola TaxID=70996 RepID=A0A0P6YA97_9CHLR|nr:hypothetical protein [Herpetosiphon geysericola]KPL90143.1 hypothetical protein SE18_07995 [Herpetosiphon geysericola]
MAKLTNLQAILAEAYKTQLEIEKSLEPDPNADPVTQLDQAWRKEQVKYLGIENVFYSKPRGNPIVVILMAGLIFITGLALWNKAVEASSITMYIGSVLFIGTSLISLFSLRNLIRFKLGEKRYLQKRTDLIEKFGYPAQAVALPIAAQRLSYSWPKKSRSEAESRFHELQAEHYESAKRDQAYRDQIQRFIAHAPEADQRYLNELAQLELSWVQERFSYLNYNHKAGYYQSPTSLGPWIVLGLGLGIIGFGIMLAAEGKPLINIVLCCLFGLMMVGGFTSVRKQSLSFDAAEQRYFAQRQQLSHDYGR